MDLEETLNSRFDKTEVIELLNSSTNAFEEAVVLALSKKKPTAWRAAWMLNHTIVDNDARLQPFVPELVAAIPGKDEGHQRELLKLIERMKLDEDSEGVVLDICMELWENIGLQPSVRYTAFKFIHGCARKYPELKQELPFLLEEHYLETLTPGVRRSLEKVVGI